MSAAELGGEAAGATGGATGGAAGEGDDQGAPGGAPPLTQQAAAPAAPPAPGSTGPVRRAPEPLSLWRGAPPLAARAGPKGDPNRCAVYRYTVICGPWRALTTPRRGASQTCPICHRVCKQHHRLGLFWRKFGYAGPDYCAPHASPRAAGPALRITPALLTLQRETDRADVTAGSTCSSAFRAHVVLCTVGPEICSRKKPCSVSAKTNAPRSHREANAGEGAPQRCGPILSYFRVPPDQVSSPAPRPNSPSLTGVCAGFFGDG